MLLVVHLFLGYWRLRDLAYYQEDPMVKCLLGLIQLSDASKVIVTNKWASGKKILIYYNGRGA